MQGTHDVWLLRYALNLVDTIKIEDSKSTLMTEGIKSPKDTLFFLTQDSEEEAKPNKKRPAAPAKNGSPIKQKTVGNKVLRNQRRVVQDEVHQTAMAKMIEHQRELHEALHARGLARFSEDGGGLAGKEGKVWKRFQSYKGEGALPPEVEKLRVRTLIFIYRTQVNCCRSLSIAKLKQWSCQSTASLCLSTLILLRMQARVTKVNSLTFVSISKRQASWLERRKIQLGSCLKSNNSVFLTNFPAI